MNSSPSSAHHQGEREREREAERGRERERERDVLLTAVGHARWVAPEVGSGRYCNKVDMYSLGLVGYALATRTLPFDELGDAAVVVAARRGVRPERGLGRVKDEGFVRILAQLWHREPDQRPSARQLLALLDELPGHLPVPPVSLSHSPSLDTPSLRPLAPRVLDTDGYDIGL